MTEYRLFKAGTIPEYTTPEWYASREAAHHLEEPGQRQRLMKTASILASVLFASGTRFSCVDLGAGDGGLLSLLGRNVEAWGYDLQPSNLDKASERGVDVRYGDVVNDDIEWGDIAIATEMLEHLVDPHEFVQKIGKNCKYLLASSPWNETEDNHYEFHTWAWDQAGYRALLEHGGFKVVRTALVFGFQIVLGVRP